MHSESDITTLQSISMAFFIGAMAWLCIILYLKDRLTLAIGSCVRRLRLSEFRRLLTPPLLPSLQAW